MGIGIFTSVPGIVADQTPTAPTGSEIETNWMTGTIPTDWFVVRQCDSLATPITDFVLFTTNGTYINDNTPGEYVCVGLDVSAENYAMQAMGILMHFNVTAWSQGGFSADMNGNVDNNSLYAQYNDGDPGEPNSHFQPTLANYGLSALNSGLDGTQVGNWFAYIGQDDAGNAEAYYFDPDGNEVHLTDTFVGASADIDQGISIFFDSGNGTIGDYKMRHTLHRFGAKMTHTEIIDKITEWGYAPAPGPSPLTFVSSAFQTDGSGAATDAVVPMPSAANGDLIFMIVSGSSSSGSMTFDTPSGWDLVDQFVIGSDTTRGAALFSRVQESGDPSTVTVGRTGGSSGAYFGGSSFAYNGQSASGYIIGSSHIGSTVGGGGYTVTLPAVDTAGSNATMVVISGQSYGSSTGTEYSTTDDYTLDSQGSVSSWLDTLQGAFHSNTTINGTGQTMDLVVDSTGSYTLAFQVAVKMA